MRRALITGGAGFIGSWLAHMLLERGWAVQVIDDLSTGSVDNVEPLKNNRHFSMAVDSVMNRSLMREHVDRADAVFHLAAAVGVRLIVEEPVRTIETNIQTTELVLRLCARENKPVLITSTSEVYGKLFNTIGPRQTGQYGMVVPRFVKQALSQEPITAYGCGNQRRSFTWVGDVVDALISLIGHPEAAGEVFNIGHYREISIHELALLVKRMTGSSSEIVFIPYDQAYETGFEDMPRRLPDINKLEALIGYRPSLDLPAMLERTIEYFREASAID